MKTKPRQDSTFNLQVTLESQSRQPDDCHKRPTPHHPITCKGDHLFLYEDGRMACLHAEAPAGDPRTQDCIAHSISILIMECAHDLL